MDIATAKQSPKLGEKGKSLIQLQGNIITKENLHHHKLTMNRALPKKTIKIYKVNATSQHKAAQIYKEFSHTDPERPLLDIKQTADKPGKKEKDYLNHEDLPLQLIQTVISQSKVSAS